MGLVPMEVLQSGFWALDPARTVAKFERFARTDPDSDEGRAWAGAITAIMCGHAYAVSAEEAGEIGPFPGFGKNRDSMLKVMRKHKDAAYEIDPTQAPKALVEAAREDWELAVKLGEFRLQFDERMVGARDVAGAAGAGAHAAGCVLHRRDDIGMLPHAQIVVGTPDGDLARIVPGAPDGAGKGADDPLHVGENPVAALRMELVDRLVEETLVVHAPDPSFGQNITAVARGIHRGLSVILPRFYVSCVSVARRAVKATDRAENLASAE